MSSETISLPLLQPYKLDTPIPVAYLIPDWVTEQESNYLLLKIEELGGQEIESETAGRTFKSKPQGWKEVNGRRLQTWGGQVLPKSSTLIPTPLPSFMTSAFPHILGRVKSSTGAFEQAKGQGPNHVSWLHGEPSMISRCSRFWSMNICPVKESCHTKMGLVTIPSCLRFPWGRIRF